MCNYEKQIKVRESSLLENFAVAGSSTLECWIQICSFMYYLALEFSISFVLLKFCFKELEVYGDLNLF